MRSGSCRRWLELSVFASLIGPIACGAVGTDASNPLLGQVAKLDRPRNFAPRISTARWSDCSSNGGADVVPRWRCAAAQDEQADKLRAVRAVVSAAVARDPIDPKAMHASAILDLESARDEPVVLSHAIEQLRKTAQLSTRRAPVLSDVAAAYLLRAEQAQRPRDLLAALNAGEESLALEPRNAVAQYNVGLALEELHLSAQAERTWRESAAAERDPFWREDATQHARRSSPRASAATPLPTQAVHVLESYAAVEPQGARALAMEQWLGEWGRRLLAGDSAGADTLLRGAETVGMSLKQRGGDESLYDEVRAIRGGRDARGAIAIGHRDFADGIASYSLASYADAGRYFDRVLGAPAIPRPLRLWAMASRGATLVYGGDAAKRDRLLRAVIAAADSARYPTLVGRAHWALGTAAIRAGIFETARREFLQAHALFVRSREDEYAGATEYLAGEATLDLGDRENAYELMTSALRRLSRYQSSVWLHNTLFILAKAAEGDGLLRAAERLAAEDVEVASRLRARVYLGEARIAHARYRWLLHEDGVLAELHDVDSLVPTLEAGLQRDWVKQHERSVEAAVITSVAPAKAVAMLDSAIAFFATRNAVRLIPALTARAQAHAIMLDERGATDDLAQAVQLVTQEGANIEREGYRATLLASVRNVYDRLVMLHLAAGDDREALRYLELARTTTLADGKRRERSVSLASMPRRVSGVELTLIADTLIVISVSDAAAAVVRTPVDSAELLGLIQRVRAALELRAGGDTLQAMLSTLYSQIIRPVEQTLGPTGTPLTIAVDGTLATVPYAALYNARTRHFLIEDHPIRLTTTLQSESDTGPVARSGASRFVVVSPAENYLRHPELPALRMAAREASSIALDNGAVLLTGTNATREAVERSLRRASVFHFAGHAIADVQRPERSYLLLASSGNSADADRLTASDIERLDLHRTRLVVLAACETLDASAVDAMGFQGLTTAFRRAGARGVVGSLWRVDDELTSALMTAFHHTYRESGSGALALRAAQLALLRGNEAALRSPSAWAGFEYSGT